MVNKGYHSQQEESQYLSNTKELINTILLLIAGSCAYADNFQKQISSRTSCNRHFLFVSGHTFPDCTRCTKWSID